MKKIVAVILYCTLLLLSSATAIDAVAGERFAIVEETWQAKRDGIVVEDAQKTTRMRIPECEVSKKEFNALRKEFRDYKRSHKKEHVVIGKRLDTAETNIKTLFDFAANSLKKFSAVDSSLGMLLAIMSIIGVGAAIIGIGTLVQGRKNNQQRSNTPRC